MNILVTGSKGQLGTEMRRLSAQHPKHRYTYADIDELDLTDAAQVARMVDEHAIDVIVNCAAFTNVDGAERQETAARKVNADAVENLARTGKKIIHISTDYIFSGEGWLPYREDDEAAPKTAYGRTKLEGEERLQRLCPNAIVFRTAWLYSPWGNNFVKTMLRYGAEKEELRVVYDQIGSPTYATDLANAIMTIITKGFSGFNLYHFTDEGAVSWYDFTKTIYSLSGINNVKVNAIESWQYPTAATRPSYSVLAKDKIKKLGAEVPYWQDSLKACLEIINTN